MATPRVAVTDEPFTTGETDLMSGATALSESALTSFIVRNVKRLDPAAARPKPRPPAWTVSRFVPRPSICFCTDEAEPRPTATRMITEATPIVIPSSVSSERSRFASTP